MELADRNYHQKLLEMCDCYLETDHLPQLTKMATSESADLEEDALKYLALAILHTVSEKARKLTFKKKNESFSVIVKNEEKTSIPAPKPKMCDRIFAIMREIIHLEEDKGQMALSLGLRNDQLDVQVKMEQKKNKGSLKFKFPTL